MQPLLQAGPPTSYSILGKALCGRALEPCKDAALSLLGLVQCVTALLGSRSFLILDLSLRGRNLTCSSCNFHLGQVCPLQG